MTDDHHDGDPEPGSELDDTRVLRYLAGHATPEDRRWVEAWLRGDPRRQELLERARAEWTAAGRLPMRWDTPAAWDRLRARIGSEAGAAPRDSLAEPAAPAPQRQRDASRVTPLLRAAAIVLLSVAIGRMWGAWEGGVVGEAPQAYHEVETRAGEQVRVRFADGSLAVLGPGSRLRHPSRFAAEREIVLEGEAYFEVEADSARPFVVRAGESVTRVLGTEFVVRARGDEGYVQVVVAEGRVALGRAGDAAAGTLLTPGFMARLEADGTLTDPEPVDVARALSWVRGRLAFDGAPLTDVVRELERAYGTRIVLADPSIASLRITAEFRNQEPAEVVRLIAASLGLSHRTTPDGFVLDRPGSRRANSHNAGESIP